VNPIDFYRVIVFIDKLDLDLNLFPGPGLKGLAIARAQAW
jgi:hypothetical protein